MSVQGKPVSKADQKGAEELFVDSLKPRGGWVEIPEQPDDHPIDDEYQELGEHD